MITYEIYKIMHLVFILLSVVVISISFAQPSLNSIKKFRITASFILFFIFVAGMGLVARIGLKHSEPFPNWIKLKIGLYIFFIFLVIENMLQLISNATFRKFNYIFLTSIIIIAVATAIYK